MDSVYILLKRVGYALLVLSVFILAGNVWVVKSTSYKVFFDYTDLPDCNVALVLGTSPMRADGSSNPFFENRIRAATLLYEKGKVKRILVSGDNRTKYYNEPLEMKKELLRRGVPASAITLDYAGLRTLDSIIRTKEIFGQNTFIIVTQSFHSYRALFIAQYYHIDAIALASDSAPGLPSFHMVYLREYLARIKAIMDLYILHTRPRYMGKTEIL